MRQNLPEIHGGGGQDVRSLNVRILCVFLLSASLTTALSFAQNAAQPASTAPANTPNSVAKIYRQINDQAVLARSGDANAIVGLSLNVFHRVGIPAEAVNTFHYAGRVAQAETDYRKGVHSAVHEEDIVKAHNNFMNTVGAPAWALTNQAEVRKLRMGYLARYPKLLANQVPPDANGKYEALSKDIAPIEAVFLATSLIYSKQYSPEYQLTPNEHVAGGTSVHSKSEFSARTMALHKILHAQSQNIDLLDLARAADALLNDLGIGSSIRPEFESIQAANLQTADKGGR
jgi:hypothetical protein